MSDRLQTALLVLALLAAGAFAWTLALRAPLRVDASPLGALPERIGDWQAKDVPLESMVESMLRADYNVQRLYTHPLGDEIWLYVGYYGTERGGRPEHTPSACYPANGWRVERERTLTVDPAAGLRANEYVVEQGGHRDLVLFWYRSYRRTGLLGVTDQTLDRIAGRLTDGRADGALVRISTPIEGSDEGTARSRLVGFAATLDPLLAAHWPVERPDPAATRTVSGGPSGL